MPASGSTQAIVFSTMKIGRKTYKVSDLAEASRLYEEARGYKRSSQMSNGLLFNDSGKQVGYVSYNARVWAGTDYVEGAECLYPPESV